MVEKTKQPASEVQEVGTGGPNDAPGSIHYADLETRLADALASEAAAIQRAEKAEADLAALADKSDSAELALADIHATLALADRTPEGITLPGCVEMVLTSLSDANARIAALETERAALVPEPVPEPKKGKVLTLHAKATRADFEAAKVIVFTDEHGMMSRDLPALSFLGEQFGAESGNRHLNAIIDFPVAIPQVIVTSAWLISDDGKPVSRYELIQPAMIGGGRPQRFNPGTLNFGFAVSAPPAA